ncbi:MAG TPA: histone H1-like repetitive region-containing protein [Candidatus Paceibacterota bacterium]|nr:histone H1-like repetitive region-containing protein [Candidatus Paceibacterota bacterium]
MAVKKVTAKKSVAKKATAKKSIAKKTPAKRSVAKKTAAKKSAVKKSTAKKSAAKKSAVKKTAAKKSAVKKSTAKKSAAKKSSVERIVIPEAPITARTSRVEIVSTPSPLTAPTPVAVPAPVQPPTPVKKESASGRVIFAVVVGIIVLGLIVWGQSNGSNKDDAAKPTPTPSVSSTPTSTPEVTATPTPTAVVISTHEAPQGVVAHYTPTGATIFWRVPNASDGLTGYNIEISLSNGPWKLISTVPATQFYLDVTKESGTGWTSFRVSSVYSDGEATPAKAFGLPGTYS